MDIFHVRVFSIEKDYAEWHLLLLVKYNNVEMD